MNTTTMKQALATVTAAGVLSLGAVGTASAASNDPGTGGQPAAQGQTQDRAARQGVRRGAIKVAAEAAAAKIGVEVAALKEAVKGGQSVGAFAESKGVSADSVVEAVVQALNGRIDQAVADGKVDEARAAKAKERVPEFAQRLVSTVPKRAQSAG
jgi:hypothetical protein